MSALAALTARVGIIAVQVQHGRVAVDDVPGYLGAVVDAGRAALITEHGETMADELIENEVGHVRYLLAIDQPAEDVAPVSPEDWN